MCYSTSGFTMKIADNTVVSMEYVLTNDDGEVLDQSAGRGPLSYVHGRREIVPGLERALTGKGPGDALSVSVAPEDGYGILDPRLKVEVPRTDLPDDLEPAPGMTLLMSGPTGQRPVTVTEVTDAHVTLDANHPLAGQTLNFDIEIKSVREAEAADLQDDCCAAGTCGS